MAATHTAPAITDAESTLMFKEAGEAPEAVSRLFSRNAETFARIAAYLKANPPKSVTTCARGSSDHAATYGKYLIETLLGVPTSSAALSVSSIYASQVQGAHSLCLAISQSGRSPDLLTAVQSYSDAGAYVVAMVNDETSPLATLADEVIFLSAGPEKSVAATKSYIASLASIALLVAHWSEDTELLSALQTLPTALTSAFQMDWTESLKVLKPANNLFVIGRGYGFGAAQEAALKLKETCALHAEAFSSAEVRHGPMAIVREGFPILAFATSDAAGDGVREVCTEFAMRGAKVWLADPSNTPAGASGHLGAVANLPALEPILMIQSFYRLANQLSVSRGLNPDTPPHLNKVTRTV